MNTNTQKTQHTPTPWTAEPQDAAQEEWVIFHESGAVARVYKGVLNPKADAAFIVRACNNHEALVAALEYEAKDSEADAIYWASERNRGRQASAMARAKRCRAALAAAKGEDV